MTLATRRLFLALILAQAAHSVEEYAFRLWDVLPPARWVSGLFTANLALGFAVANAVLVGFGLWCHLARVRTSHPSARTLAWFWTVLESANGIAHLSLAVRAGGYFPGAATALLLLGLAVPLGVSLLHEPGE